MENGILIYDSKADIGTYSGGSWALPLTNLQDPRPSKKARSTDLSLSSTKFRIDLGAAVSTKAFAITNTNLTAAALYRTTWYSDAYSTAVGNTDWLPVPGYPSIDPDGIGAGIFHVFAAAPNYRYWQHEFNDSANPAGYIEIGLNKHGPCYQFAINYGDDNADGMEPNTSVQRALGGTKYFSRRKPARTFRFGFDRTNDAEMVAWRAIRKISNLNKQVVIIPDPDDTAYLNDTCFVGTLAQAPALKRLTGGPYAAASFDVIEAV